ncbi:GAF domain-containing protein [Pseudarthrobacter enclensis]|uniref:Response regulator receiver protein n=1 Tax=Pseudarthrobacter enclensis TaxID=993070 RepID=A0A0V8IVC5_9MICC|nr:GAF and ANTAR domain-containing protein [Pseudarthrobacter enclensis]KSU78647.1 response regulator receiver protein [Pseudarthrobacter enclensis]SCB74502.1 GAF domain-containing protein [Pseudarthrobacter enclensis]
MATDTDTTEEPVGQRLGELVLTSSHVEEFLHDLSVEAAKELSSAGQQVSCSVTLVRRKKAATVASSDNRARAMDEFQYTFQDGPCLSALRQDTTIHVPDLRREDRWPEYVAAVNEGTLKSVLAVPIPLDGNSRAALNLYSDGQEAFDAGAVTAAERFARDASTSLRLALRIAQLTDARDDLATAMASRTVIDLAAGAIMSQNRCSQETAMEILKSASSTRNIKLRDVAAKVVASVAGDTPVSTHFDA